MDHSEVIRRATEQNNIQTNEVGMIVSFYDRQMYQKRESEEQNRPVYKSVLFVEIKSAGKSSIVDRKKKPTDEIEYPTAWARYVARTDKQADGMPIEEWQKISRTQAAELKHLNIHTIELLAEVTDANVSNLGPMGQSLRKSARDYVDGASENEMDISELQGIVSTLKAQIEDLKAAKAKPDLSPKVKPDDAALNSSNHS